MLSKSIFFFVTHILDLMKSEKVKEKKSKKGAFWLLCVSGIAVTMLLFCQFYYADNTMTENRFYENTTINGINVSHLTEEEAGNIIEYNLLKNRDKIKLTLVSGEEEWQFKGSDFTVVSDLKPVLSEVMKIGRGGNVIEKARTQNKIKKEGLSYYISYKTVLGNIEDIVEDIASKIEEEGEEPQLVFNPLDDKPFSVIEGKEGKKVNRELLYQRIDEELQNNTSATIEIPLDIVPNSISNEDLENSVSLRSSFSTNYASSSKERKNNVRKALEAFNGMIIAPGQEISFNETTGARTEENGYKEANIILNGAYVKGSGGGACQSSTTLYNALLLADLEILEVNHHSLPASYVPLSFDAMVSEGVSDLKFKNQFETPVYIKTFGDEKNISVEIYGKPFEEGEEIKTRAEFIKVLPHSGDQVVPDTTGEFSKYVLYKGEYYRQKYPKEGYESKGYIQYYKNGELVEEKQIRHDYYQPQSGIVIEGTEDIGEGMKLPKNDVKIIPPQKDTKVSSEIVKKRIENERPSAYNP